MFPHMNKSLHFWPIFQSYLTTVSGKTIYQDLNQCTCYNVGFRWRNVKDHLEILGDEGVESCGNGLLHHQHKTDENPRPTSKHTQRFFWKF